MKTGLIHYTRDMENRLKHFDKGHTNVVFGVAGFEDINMVASLSLDLLTMTDISPKIRVTLPDQRKNDTKIGAVISMDAGTFLELMTKQFRYEFNTVLNKNLRNLVSGSRDINFLVDEDKNIIREKSVIEYGLSDNGEFELVQSDVGALKDKGLSEHEIDTHATVTVKYPDNEVVTLKLRDWTKIISDLVEMEKPYGNKLRNLFVENGIDL